MNTSRGSQTDPLDAVVEAIVQRCRQGERPSLDEYTQRYPDLADRLRQVFPALMIIEVFGSVGGPATGPAVPAADRIAPPARLGDYRLLREVGRGGMGVVYEAVQESLNRHVALKVLSPVVARRGLFLERFRREARAAARLHHTNIVPVYGVGEEEGTCYYAMQFIQGQALDAVLQDVRRLRSGVAAPAGAEAPTGSVGSVVVAQGLLTGDFHDAAPPEVTETHGLQPAGLPESHSSLGSQPETAYYRSIARLGVQAAEALAYAHGQGVLHRDVKPSNLLLDTQGTLWVTDFGLAKADDSDDLTHTGDLVGTLRYMAPERFEGKADVRSDVYALGVTLYEMLTLRLPFTAADRAALVGQISHTPPLPPRQFAALLPRDLETIVLKAMAREPSARYAGAAQLADDLRRFLENRPIKARRSSTTEHFRRWCRRNPALATLAGTVAALLVLITAISVTAALQYRSQLQRAETAEKAEKTASQEALTRLWNSYLVQARAGRMSRQPGQRFASLRAIQEALRLPVPEGHSKDELRTEAIACLLLPDLELEQEWGSWTEKSSGFAVNRSFERYARGDLHGNVSVRRVADDAELFRLPGDGVVDNYGGLAFSPDGRFLHHRCSTIRGPHARLWRLDGPRPASLPVENYHGYAFAPDSPQFAAAYPGDSIRLYDLNTGRELRRFPLAWAYVRQLCWNPRQPLLAVDCGSGYRLLDLATGNARPEVPVPGGVSWMDWHPDGRVLAVGGNELDRLNIYLYDTATGRPTLPPLIGHRTQGIVLRFNHAGDRLLSTDWSSNWRLWDTRTGQQLLTLPTSGTRLDFRLDDRLISATLARPRLQFVRFQAGEELCTVVSRGPHSKAYMGRSTPAPLDPEGRLMAVNTHDGIALLDLLRGEEVARLPLSSNAPVLFEASGALLTHGSNGTLRWPVLTEPATGRRRYGPPQRLYVPIPQTVPDAGSSPDGQVLALPRLGGAVVLHRSSKRTVQLVPQQDSHCCAVSPDGHWVAVATFQDVEESGVLVWNADTGKLAKTLPMESGSQVHFSPDGRWLLTSAGRYRLWKLGTWEEGPSLSGPTVPGMGAYAAFSADGLLALSDAPSAVRLVAPTTGREIARLSIAEPTRLMPQRFTPDSTRLVCLGSENNAVYIFNLRLIREQLAEMGLDWDAPAYPPARAGRGSPDPAPQPLAAEFVGVELATDAAKMRQYQIQLQTLRLWANPFDTRTYLERGRLRYEDQAWQPAHADFDIAFRLDPTLWQARHNRALTAAQLGRWQQARDDADASLRQHPEETGMVRIRAQACQKLGEHQKALGDLTWLLGRFPNSPSLYTERVVSYAALGKQAEADADRKKVLALLPDDASALNARAWQLLVGDGLRDPALALELARKAVRLRPSHECWNTLGVAYYRNERYPEAVASLEKSRAGRTEHLAHDLFFLAMCHQRLGDPVRARQDFDRAIRWIEDNQAKLDAGERKEQAEFRAEAEKVLQLQQGSSGVSR
jgi:serine/threonine protein kinase/WD40 repeat protein/tetratricopeptide (TPR) repeat protein